MKGIKNMSKYRFKFSEINYGTVVVESDKRPSDDEVIQAILDGEADYYNTEFDDITLSESIIKQKSVNAQER